MKSLQNKLTSMVSNFKPRLRRQKCLRSSIHTIKQQIDPMDTEEEEMTIADLQEKIKTPKVREHVTKGVDMLAQASWFQWATFTWSMSLDEIARKRRITTKDFGGMPEEETVEHLSEKLEKTYMAQPQGQRNFYKAYLQTFKTDFMIVIMFSFLNQIINMASMTLEGWLSDYIESEDAEFEQGLRIICLMVLKLVGGKWFYMLASQYQRALGSNGQQAIMTMFRRRAIMQPESAQRNYGPDCFQEIVWTVQRALSIWSLEDYYQCPMTFIFVTTKLYGLIGNSCFAVIAAFYGIMMLQNWSYTWFREEGSVEERKKQEKLAQMKRQSIYSIRAIKQYGWDDYFLEKISTLQTEVNENAQKNALKSSVQSIVRRIIPQLFTPVTIIISSAFGNELGFSQVFQLVNLVEELWWPIYWFSELQDNLIDKKLGFMKTEDFLGQPLIEKKIEEPKHPDYAVHIDNKSFSWGVKTLDRHYHYQKMFEDMKLFKCKMCQREKTVDEEEEEWKARKELEKHWKLDEICSLKDITLKVPKGQFVCIIGKAGSGKSSLLKALFGELLPIPKEILDSYKGNKDLNAKLEEHEAHAMMMELMENTIKKNEYEVNGSIAYTAQQPWIRNKKIRDNIIYDLDFMPERYVDTVQFCELERDILSQQKGDQTMLGENGINLSGGQQARLGLARAVYQDKDIYLMDDPISALDATTRHQIIENVYFGTLKDRTRILVTHAVDFLERADQIVLMDDGKILGQGKYDEMMSIKEFKELMQINDLNKQAGGEQPKPDQKEETDQKKDDSEATEKKDSDLKDNPEKSTSKEETDVKDEEKQTEEKEEEVINIEEQLDAVHAEDNKDDENDSVGKDDMSDDDEEPEAVTYPSKLSKLEKLRKVIDYQSKKLSVTNEKDEVEELFASDEEESSDSEDEKEKPSNMKTAQSDSRAKTLWRVLGYNKDGIFRLIAVMVIQFLTQSVSIKQSLLSKEWGRNVELQKDWTLMFQHTGKVMGYLVLSLSISSIEQNLMSTIRDKMKASVDRDLLKAVIQAPVNRFFDLMQPPSKIETKLEGDLNLLYDPWDGLFAFAIEVFSQLISLGTTMMLIAGTDPKLLLPIGIAAYVAYRCQIYEGQTKQEIDNASGMFYTEIRQARSELSSGAINIRAMRKRDYALNMIAEGTNYNNLAQRNLGAVRNYYSMIHLCVTGLIVISAALNVLVGKSQGTDPSILLLVFQRVQSIGWIFDWMMEQFAEKQGNIIKIEKVFKLLSPKMPKEVKTQPRQEGQWPTKGSLELKNVRMRYRPTTELVLKGMNVSIKGGEKVGIVGRTGAGKSTLAQCLTRITEIDKKEGQILIDGVDISQISLQQVREAITIIPQKAVIFQGTIKFNLDPTDICKDEEIMELLEESGLKEMFEKQKEKDKKAEEEAKKAKEEEEKKADEETTKTAEEIKEKHGAEKADEYLLKKKEQKEKKKKDEEEKKKKREAEEARKPKKEETLLDYELLEDGGNLSSGEKALICICRAILRKSKFVILDEATAAVDLKTEVSISKVINEKFAGCTMLVIAHRLQTIMDSDKVMVLGDGKVEDFGDPNVLKEKEGSPFKKLVDRMANLGNKKKDDKETSLKE